MKLLGTLLIVTTCGAALLGCQDDRGGPTSPRAAAKAAVSKVPLVVPAESETCPCWSARGLAAAFPAADFYFEDVVADLAAGDVQLQAVDVANGRVVQARAAFDPFAEAAGDNWCQVGTFGEAGLVSERVSVIKISADEFAGCVRLLEAHASAVGASSRAAVDATD